MSIEPSRKQLLTDLDSEILALNNVVIIDTFKQPDSILDELESVDPTDYLKHLISFLYNNKRNNEFAIEASRLARVVESIKNPLFELVRAHTPDPFFLDVWHADGSPGGVFSPYAGTEYAIDPDAPSRYSGEPRGCSVPNEHVFAAPDGAFVAHGSAVKHRRPLEAVELNRPSLSFISLYLPEALGRATVSGADR